MTPPNRERPAATGAGVILALVCAFVVGFYFWKAQTSVSELGRDVGADAYYNLLVAGFADGQLHLEAEVPGGLKGLADPYDPQANQSYRKIEFAPLRLHDASFHDGKLHLYFGVTPAVLLFWPFHAVTGKFLPHAHAVAVFCSIGFLVGVWLVREIRRQWFPQASPWLGVGGAIAVGLANSVPVMLWRMDVWEVPISCAYMLVMVSLAAMVRALRGPDQRARWMAVASLAYVLAVGARPAALPAAVVLLVPLVMAWQDAAGQDRRKRFGRLLLAVALPMLVVGAALALYNHLRFGSPFEFGQRYQLAGDRQDDTRHFSAAYLWFNFRLYFLSWAGWRDVFPFLRDVAVPPLPAGHGDVDMPFGILVNTPFTLLALGTFAAWRARSSPSGRSLRALIVALLVLFGVNALLLCLFYGTCTRYQVEFHPPLMLLAVTALFALNTRPWPSPAARRIWTAVWIGCLGYSAVFGVLKSFQGLAANYHARGVERANAGDAGMALAHFEQAIRFGPERLDPRFFAAVLCERLGRIPAAISHYEQLVRIAPHHAIARNNLGQLLRQSGRAAEALEQFQAAIQTRPDFFEAHVNLGAAFQEMGLHAEAVKTLDRAVVLRPDFAEARYWMALSLRALGRTEDARREYNEARRLKPELPAVAF